MMSILSQQYAATLLFFSDLTTQVQQHNVLIRYVEFVLANTISCGSKFRTLQKDLSEQNSAER